ncbi:hypothetical protein Zmor_018943 [Zophobas morio]|uniref:Uncharacterized protein n=1 Tax=Zophobas morio TaxID=2755281 RepID=A0AA38IFP1_9CUCU|nr:hypothetical protein Zmor_018943 [Zophobas morio]
MKSFKTTLIFLIVELSFVLPTPNSAVITCYHLVGNSWEKAQVVENASTHQIKEICNESDEQKQCVEVKGSVKILYEDSFKGIPKLSEIEVYSETNLEEIEPGTFTDLPKLDILDLSGNNLQEIKSGTFVNLKVQHLILQRNSISLLREGAFVNLSDVQKLSLERNNLQELKRGVFQELYVVQLEFGSNNISKIEVGTFASVFPRDEGGIILNLSNNSFTEIDASVFDYKYSVYALMLAKNSISILRPGDLRNLPNLKYVLLSENKLKEVPEGVFNGSKIVSIELDNNEISFIGSKAFDDMKDLTFVNISNNKLKEWNNDWFCGEGAKVIRLSYNYLETIPVEAFTNIPGGSMLKLDHNRIQSISDSAFKNVTYLDSIDLSYNEIQEWNVDLMRNVKTDGAVDLNGNKIKCPESGSNSLAPKARIVYLSYSCPQVIEKALYFSDEV